KDVTVIQVEDTRYALACISAAWFGHPAEKLKTIGITGTKGKTTTTYLIKSILENAGHKTGLIGTIETIIGEEKIPSANTTPESYLIQEYFRSEEHTSELQSRFDLVCRLLLEKKKRQSITHT